MAKLEKQKPSTALVKAGVVTSAHGIRGAVKIRSFTENPADLLSYGDVTDENGGHRYEITITSHGAGMLIATIDGITTREQAEKLKGTTLWISRAKLPKVKEGEYYPQDLIGTEVKLNDNSIYGRVADVHDFGAGDIIAIERPDGSREKYAFTKRNFPKVDIKNGMMVLSPPDIIEAVDEE